MTERTRRIIEVLNRIDYRNQTPQRLAEAIAEVDGLPQTPLEPVWWRWRFLSQSHGWSKWIALGNDEIPAFRELQGHGLETGRIELEPLFADTRPLPRRQE